ncbi:hypothetical protein [Microvirga sp. G4-2]|uniref:hypothetical protein n=1 Tax=Microvirga sp. G4-2 TaxID=3434467 RepID=UPI0040449DC7
MTSLERMTEQELVAHLCQLADECDRLGRELARTEQRQRFSKDAQDVARAAQDGQGLLTRMNRLMDRMRAAEGHLMRIRGQLRPLPVP